MTWRINILAIVAIALLSACGIYGFSGANIQGKTIDLQFIENKAPLIAPALSQVLTEKLRNRVISQTSLTQSAQTNVDYVLSGTIINYDIGIAAVSADQATKNRLSITVEINFVNNLDKKASFKKTYNKFADYNANSNLQSVERELIDQISGDIADAVFNDAFVNW
jgi:hypothetical protein